MTLQEAKDQVAIQHGFKNTNALEKAWGQVPERICDEAAEIYGRSKFEDGAAEQLLLIRKHLSSVDIGYPTLGSAPQPEFKP